jgi:hypothetical protein
MEPEIARDWRDLVRAHLQAHWEDVRTRQVAGLSNAEARFIKEFGTDRVRLGHDKGAKARCDSLLPPPPEECYEVIEQSADQVLVQVRRPERQPNKLRVPITTIRFLLTQGPNGWLLDGIFHPCISCNFRVIDSEVPLRESGKCFFGDGTGRSYSSDMVVRGFWPFRRTCVEKVRCTHCGGTGTCATCAKEAMPGWVNVFSMDGLREPTAGDER